jgi:hypothetical protein
VIQGNSDNDTRQRYEQQKTSYASDVTANLHKVSLLQLRFVVSDNAVLRERVLDSFRGADL